MASSSSTGDSAVFSVDKSSRFLSGAADARLRLDASRRPAVARALALDLPFPPGEVKLGALDLRTQRGRSVDLGPPSASVAFSLGAGAKSSLGVYPTASRMAADLALESAALGDWTFEAGGAQRYLALRLGYDLSASARGGVGLGAGGSVGFGAEGAKNAFFAVVRAFASNPPSRAAVAETVETWKLPSQIETLDDLPPGTWLVSEVDGSLGLELGARLGFDQNWIRRLDLGRLTGDVGLRIQARTEVALGFDLSGTFSLVVGRESLDAGDGKVRLRLYKQRRKGRDLALHAGARIRGSSGELLPEQLDDFIASVLGTYGPQVVEDLRAVGSAPAHTLAASFLADFARKEFPQIADASVTQAYERAHAQVRKFVADWDSLGADTSALLWSFVGRAAPAEAVALRRTLDALAGEADDQIVAAVRHEVEKVDFFRTPFGQWLESVAGGNLLAILSGSSAVAELRRAARATANLIGGGVLTELASWMDRRLSLTAIENADIDSLDDAAREKLSEFLQKPLDAAGLETVRQVIVELRAKGSELYDAARRAMNRTYGVSLAAAYQSATTKTALLDVTFDLAADPGLADALRRAIGGDFGDLLAGENPNVRLREAALTHQIRRSRHVEVQLPFFSASTQELARSLARMTVEDRDGRLLVYDLEASDETVRRGRWASDFAVALRFPVGPSSNVRYYGSGESSKPTGGSTYRFRQAFPRATGAQLADRVQPLVEQYFPDHESLGPLAGLSETAAPGDALIGFETRLPARALAHWLQAPAEREAPQYRALSLAVQRSLRRLLPYVYFQDPERYADLDAAAPVLLYGALPASTAASYSRGELTLNAGPGVYWDYADPDLRRAFAYSSSTTAALERSLERARKALEHAPGLSGRAKSYAAKELESVRSAGSSGYGDRLLAGSLLAVEARVIAAAVRAGRRMAEFVSAGRDRPDEAIESLAEAGVELTKAFHRRLTDLFDPDDDAELLRNLGSLAFLAASEALGGQTGRSRPTSVLEIDLLDGSAPFPPPGYLENGTPPPGSAVKWSRKAIHGPLDD